MSASARWDAGANGIGRESVSTAPWDQPRNATTVMLYFAEALTADETSIVHQLRLSHPTMRDPQVHVIHHRKAAADSRGPSVCCLISWENPSYRG